MFVSRDIDESWIFLLPSLLDNQKLWLLLRALSGWLPSVFCRQYYDVTRPKMNFV